MISPWARPDRAQDGQHDSPKSLKELRDMLKSGLLTLRQEKTQRAYHAILRTMQYGRAYPSPMSTIYRMPTSYGTINVLEIAFDGQIRIRGAGVDRCQWSFEVPQQSQLHRAIMSVARV